MAEWITPKTDWADDFINYTDLNRIDGNYQYLSDVLMAYGYDIFHLPYDEYPWMRSHYPWFEEMERIRINCVNLKDRYFSTTQAPQTIDYTDAGMLNIIEQMALDAYNSISRMVAAFQYCGDPNAYCGGI